MDRTKQELLQSLRGEIQECVRQELGLQFKEVIDLAERQFNERLLQVKSELEKENARLRDRIEELKRRDLRKRLHAEIDRVTKTLNDVEIELARMVNNEDVELSRVIQHNALQSELKSYIRGLSYPLQLQAGAHVSDTVDEEN
jgi:hypothetical protein